MKHPTFFTTPDISKRMSNVHLKKGIAEVMLARELWHHGLRYRYNDKRLPGSPDIAVLKYRIAIFIDGEFWHGQDWENRKTRLKRNKDYWIEKIEENMARDKRNDQELEKMGWYSLRFWEKEVKYSLEQCVNEVLDIIVVRCCEDILE